MTIKQKIAYPAEMLGMILLFIAFLAFFIYPYLAAAILCLYIVLCLTACFFPATNFLVLGAFGGCRTGRRPGPSAERALGRDDETDESLAGDLAVDRGDALAATKLAQALHGHFQAELIARHHDVFKAAFVDRREQAEPIAEAGLLGHEHPHRLRQGLDLEHAGHDGPARKWPGRTIPWPSPT